MDAWPRPRVRCARPRPARACSLRARPSGHRGMPKYPASPSTATCGASSSSPRRAGEDAASRTDHHARWPVNGPAGRRAIGLGGPARGSRRRDRPTPPAPRSRQRRPAWRYRKPVIRQFGHARMVAAVPRRTVEASHFAALRGQRAGQVSRTRVPPSGPAVQRQPKSAEAGDDPARCRCRDPCRARSGHRAR